MFKSRTKRQIYATALSVVGSLSANDNNCCTQPRVSRWRTQGRSKVDIRAQGSIPMVDAGDVPDKKPHWGLHH